MGDTSLTLDDDTKERLGLFRHPGHDSWDEALNAIMDFLVPYERLAEDGCSYHDCTFVGSAEQPYDELPGLIEHYVPANGPTGSNYFCSREHVAEMQDEIDRHYPTDPDLVRIGGREQFVAEFTDATFGMDGEAQWITLPIPGAFDGTEDVHEGEYDYLREPVFLKKDGKWTYSALVGNIHHEEGTTTLGLTKQGGVLADCFHPDEEKRKEAREMYGEWVDGECEHCGAGLRYETNDPPEECHDCGEELDIEPVDTEAPKPDPRLDPRRA